MIIKSIEINNFLIIGHANLKLDGRGLVRISGENNDDSTSSSNGSGKSTLVEAIYWVLFGDTLRSLKSVDGVVNNKMKKDCFVRLECEEEGTTYLIERYRKHSKKKNNLYLYINGVDSRGKDNRETQQYIEDIISVDKTSFANSIVFGQGYSKNLRRFSELTDKEQKECLEKILDLEAFSLAYQKTSKEIKELIGHRDVCQSHKELTANTLDELVENLREALESKENFALTKEQRIVEAQESRQSILEEIEGVNLKISELPEVRTEEEVGKDIDEYKEELRNYRIKKDQLKDKYDESKNTFVVTRSTIKKDIESFYNKLNKLSDGSDEDEECFHCGALVSTERLQDRRSVWEFEIQDREKSVEEVNGKISQLNERYLSKREEIVEVIDMISEVLDKLSEEKRNIFAVEKDREMLNSKVEYGHVRAQTYLEQITKLKEESNPYGPLVGKLKESIEDKKKKVKEIEEEVSLLEKEIKYYEFWKVGFSRKGIRSFLLDQIIPFLNERANKYLGILTDGGIQVCFNARKQLSSGEWRENFNVEVTNRSAADTYEGNSGGEKRRIDLAISLAINDFIASRSGKRFNILLLDEVFENIDETGVYFVIKALGELARNRSSVFVITHQEALASHFDDTILLSRKGGLSFLQ